MELLNLFTNNGNNMNEVVETKLLNFKRGA